MDRDPTRGDSRFHRCDGRARANGGDDHDLHTGETLDFTGVGVGDKVEFLLKVDWDASPPAEVTNLTALPDDTRLVFTR